MRTCATVGQLMDRYEDPRHPGRTYGGPSELDDNNPEKSLLGGEDLWPAGLVQLVQDTLGTGGFLGAYAGMIKDITGQDPFELVNRLLSGDWRKLYREAMLFDDAGGAFRAVYANVFNGRIGIEQCWRGHAAGSAENWLDDYKNASKQHAEFMTEAGQRILAWARASARAATHHARSCSSSRRSTKRWARSPTSRLP